MKTVAKFFAAGIVGAGAMYGCGETVIQIRDIPHNEELAECQLGIQLDNTLIGSCAETVIAIAQQENRMDSTVHASPELKEFGTIEEPGRLAIVVDSYKEELVEELETRKKDIRGQRIGNAIFGFIFGPIIYGLFYDRNRYGNHPGGPPPKNKEYIPESAKRHLRAVA